MTDKKTTKPQKEHDRFKTINDMVDGDFAKFGMTATERIVYFVMWRHADEKSHCKLSYSRIASGSGLKKRACEKAVKSLIEKGVAQIVKKGNYTGAVNHYRIYGKTKKLLPPKTPET